MPRSFIWSFPCASNLIASYGLFVFSCKAIAMRFNNTRMIVIHERQTPFCFDCFNDCLIHVKFSFYFLSFQKVYTYAFSQRPDLENIPSANSTRTQVPPIISPLSPLKYSQMKGYIRKRQEFFSKLMISRQSSYLTVPSLWVQPESNIARTSKIVFIFCLLYNLGYNQLLDSFSITSEFPCNTKENIKYAST